MNNVAADTRSSILLVIDGREYGGGERVFHQVARGLRDRYQMLAATWPMGRFARMLTEDGVPCLPLNIARQFSPAAILRLASYIRQHRIGCIHSQGVRADFHARLAGRIAGVRRNICTLAMPVEGFDVPAWKRWLYRLPDAATERWVDRFLVVSERLAKLLVEGRGLSRKRAHVIYNGVELSHYRPGITNGSFRRELGLSAGTPLVGAVGRLVWQKGFADLIRALPEVARGIPEVHLALVGDGPLSGELAALAERCGVGNLVHFAGFREDVAEVLDSFDVVAIPSLREGFPMVTLEAMAMAKPIVAANIPGIDEQLTDGRDGLLVVPERPEELARAVAHLLNSPEEAARLATAARERVAVCFSVEKMLEQTAAAYQGLLK